MELKEVLKNSLIFNNANLEAVSKRLLSIGIKNFLRGLF